MAVAGEGTRLLSDRVKSPATVRATSGSPGQWLCGQFHSSHVIVAVTLLERTALYGISNNLVQYLQYQNGVQLTAVFATIATLLCTNLSKVGAIITGYLLDTRFSSFHVLVFAFTSQLAGAVCLTASSFLELCSNGHDGVDLIHSVLVIVGLLAYAIGIMASFASEIVLGVQQYAAQGEDYLRAQKFFAQYYFAINTGAFIASTVISTVQYNFLFGIGFSISVFFYAAATVLLLKCKKYLHSVRATTVPHPPALAIVREAWRLRRTRIRTYSHDGSSIQVADQSWMTGSWVLKAEDRNGGSFKYNDVACVQNFLGVMSVILSTIFYQTIIAQGVTTYSTQGNYLKLPIARSEVPVWQATNSCHFPSMRDPYTRSLFIPASVFSAVNPLAVMLAIPIVHCGLYPRWRKTFHGLPLDQLQRMGIGMLLALLSLACALLVENKRREKGVWDVANVTSPFSPDQIFPIADVSIFFQIPQYTLSGIAEVFVVISALDFAYVHAPVSMKGTCMGMVYSVMGLSSLISVATLTGIEASGSDIYYRTFTAGANSNSSQYGRGRVHIFYGILLLMVSFGLFAFSLAKQKFGIVKPRAESSVEEGSRCGVL